jgi:hypothetical protein
MNKIINILASLIFACPLCLGASEPGKITEGASHPLMKHLEILHDRLRPFISIAFEYTVEREHNGTWVIMERHRLMEDRQTGFFRDQIMRRSSPQKEHQYYEERLWNGEVSLSIDGGARFSKELKLEDRDNGFAGYAYILRGGASSFCIPFWFWDDGGLVHFSEFLENPIEMAKNTTTDGKETSIVLGTSYRLAIDNASGQVVRKVVLAGATEDTSYEAYRFDISKSIIKDGWQIPVEFVYTSRQHHAPEKALKTRFKVVPESVKINLTPEEFDLKVRIPLGAHVYDHIKNIDYTATEMDSFGKEKLLKEKLDALLEKAEKQKETSPAKSQTRGTK